MLRKYLSNKQYGVDPYFKLRGTDHLRIESFSDAVFAFALTLLIVNLQVPTTFNELLDSMYGFLAFGICTVLLIMVWYDHYIYFLKYGLRDRFTFVINICLLFIILFYVYPLKFLFSFLTKLYTQIGKLLLFEHNATARETLEHLFSKVILPEQVPLLMIIFAIALIAINVIFYIFYQHAYRKRDELDLNEIETYDTITERNKYLVSISVPALSIVAAACLPLYLNWIHGPIYALFGVILPIYSRITKRKRNKRIAQYEAKN